MNKLILMATAIALAISAGCPDINLDREVKFVHKLPAMHLTTPPNGTYNNYELGYPSIMTTTDPRLGVVLYQLRNNIYTDRHLVFIDGKTLMCSKNWIRDHILLPAGRSCRQLRVDGKNHRFKTVSAGSSNYVDFAISASGTADIEVFF